jgi:hypothetical protein
MNRFDITLQKPVPEDSKPELTEIQSDIAHLNLNIKKLNIKTGDTIVITPDKLINELQAQNIYNLFTTHPIGVFVVVLNEGLDIKSLSDTALREMGLKRIEDPTTPDYYRYDQLIYTNNFIHS